MKTCNITVWETVVTIASVPDNILHATSKERPLYYLTNIKIARLGEEERGVEIICGAEVKRTRGGDIV